MKGIYQLFKRDGYDMLSSRKQCIVFVTDVRIKFTTLGVHSLTQPRERPV